MSLQRSRRSEAGVSVITILVAAGLLGIAVLLVVSGTTDKLRTIWRIKGGDAVSEIEDHVRQRVREVVGDYVEESLCGQDANFFQLNWNVGSDFAITWLKPADVATSPDLSYTGNAAHQAAMSRCADRQTFQTGSESIENAEGIYLCLLIKPTDALAPASTVLKRGAALAEFSVRFIDVSTGEQKQCGELLDIAGEGKDAQYMRGMVSFYTLYWRSGPAAALNYLASSGTIYTKMHY